MDQVDALLATAHQLAGRLELKKYDISGKVSRDVSVSAEKGSVDQISASDSTNVLVRVWHPSGAVGVTVTSDISENGLEAAFAMARDVSAQAPKEDAPIFSPEAMADLADVATPEPSEPVSPGVLVDAILSIEDRVMSAHPAIKAIPYNGLVQQAVTSFYCHSEGAARRKDGAHCYVYLYPKAEEEGRAPRMGHSTKLSTSFGKLDIDGCIEESVNRVLSHLAYEKIPSGKYTTVFSPHAILSLLGAFSNLWNARSILDKKSLSKAEDLGASIASPLLSLSDHPHHPKNTLMPLFDGEGTPTRHTPILQAGKLVSFLQCANTAQAMQQPLTGHAVMGARVGVSSHFLHLQRAEGAECAPRRLEDAEDIVYVDKVTALHAGVQALQGSFSLPFDGWRYQGGKRSSIEAATVAGDILDLLKQIVYISDEEVVIPSGAAADTWVEGLSITGSEG
ncbi:MAG: TldD/PmbA family protein [Myxococcales bacterium]|nr:TldD/PmbA family protein [Myxococcales bacterium]